MDIIVILVCLLMSLLVAGKNTRVDFFLALLFTIVFIVLASTYKFNPDYENYYLIINDIHQSQFDGLLEVWVFNIDPIFVWIVKFVKLFSDDFYWVFFVYAILGFFPKFLLSSLFPKYRGVFICLYGLFLAPALEFAAIRAAAGISALCLLILFNGYRKKIAISVTSIFLHISTLIPAIFLIIPFKVISNQLMLFLIICSTIVSMFSIGLIGGNERAVIYLSNAGTVNAQIFPIGAFILLILLSPLKFEEKKNLPNRVHSILLTMYIMCGFCLGITSSFVTIAFRLLEILFVLMFIVSFFVITSNPSSKYLYRAYLVLIGVGILVSYRLLSLGIWKNMLLGAA